MILYELASYEMLCLIWNDLLGVLLIGLALTDELTWGWAR